MFSGYIESKGDLYEITLSTSVDGFRVRVRLERQSWANSFSPQYISELTKKTGCHKEFDTFITLLAKAITGKENTECSLQILTPNDLESLRSGSNSGRQPTAHMRPPGDRRYLLLTVHNNYEKNHFPLSLLPESSQVFNPTSILKSGNTLHFPNKTESDALELRTIIGQLQDEIRRLKAPDTVAHQKSNFEALVYENMMLKQKLEEAKTEVKTVTSTKHQRQIRKLVEEMENALSTEKTKNKKNISQKNAQIKSLEGELRECQSENRQLDSRLSKLKTELETYKRGRKPTISHASVSRIRSRENSYDRNSQRSRQNSRERTSRPVKRASYSASTQSSLRRSREVSPAVSSRSTGRRPNIRSRDVSPACSVSSRRSVSSVGSAKSVGSVGSRGSFKRFDPSAYVKAKKQKEAATKKTLIRNKRPPNIEKNKSRSRADSIDSNYSRKSRLSRKSTVTRSSTPDPSHHSSHNDTLDSYTGSQASLRLEDSLINGSSFNIGEIDQRLEALQMYINEALH